MFWNAVIGALEILMHWEVYVASIVYLIIFIAPIVISSTFMTRWGGSAGNVIGCLSIILMPILKVVAVAVFILTLSPIILGLGSDAAWTLPWYLMTAAPWPFIKLVIVLLLAAIIISFIPIQSFQTLILGGLCLLFILGILFEPELIWSRMNLVPSFWFVVGIIVVGTIMSWLGMIVGVFLLAGLERVSEDTGQLVVFPVAAIFGFIPVFIYGAWLGAQLRGAG